MNSAILETNRLLLRRFNASDTSDLLALLGDARVMESSIDGAMNANEVSNWLSDRLREYAENSGIEVYGVVVKASASLIGYCGLFQ
ncbi:MAG: GNAT family N-acetyltransferase, partial [Pseudomonadota bacterium]